MKLSIIIIEYYCLDQVRDCLGSIREYLSDMDPECLVLSNSEYAAPDLADFQKQLGDARLIRAPGNLGYAGGVNAALREARGEYVYILNPDCRLTDGNVRNIIREMDERADWAIAGPRVINEQGEVQPSSRRFPRPGTFLLVRSVLSHLPGGTRERDRYFMKDYDRSTPRAVDWVSGGATLAKVAALGSIGGMDERFFLYMEDVDLCRSAWLSGFKVVYHPCSTVVHAGRHQSIRAGWRAFANAHLRWHLYSLLRYFRKYQWKTRPDSDFYRQATSGTPFCE